MANINAVTSFFPKAQEGFTTTLNTTISAGATTIVANTTAGYSIGDTIVWIIDPASTTLKQVLTGQIAAGNQIINVVWTYPGTNSGHTAGATIVDYTTATGFDMVSVGIQKHANQDGSLQQTPVLTAIGTGGLSTTRYANASVTPDKLATGAVTASVLTSESSASQTYGDNLATVGPTVTATIGANGLALVSIYCRQGSNSTTSNEVYTGFAASGANTIAASDTQALSYQVYAANAKGTQGASFLLTGLTAGSTTFKLQYRVTGDTGTWLNRRIAVIPL